MSGASVRPPSSGRWLARRPSAFSFPCPFRVCPFWARCVGVGVFLSSFAFRTSCSGQVARHFIVMSHVHLMVNFVSSTLLRQGVCVCVWTICIDVKLLAAGGRWGTFAVSGQRRRCNVPVKTYLLYYISSPTPGRI